MGLNENYYHHSNAKNNNNDNIHLGKSMIDYNLHFCPNSSGTISDFINEIMFLLTGTPRNYIEQSQDQVFDDKLRNRLRAQASMIQSPPSNLQVYIQAHGFLNNLNALSKLNEKQLNSLCNLPENQIQLFFSNESFKDLTDTQIAQIKYAVDDLKKR